MQLAGFHGWDAVYVRREIHRVNHRVPLRLVKHSLFGHVPYFFSTKVLPQNQVRE
jgi:hypothetical protein